MWRRGAISRHLHLLGGIPAAGLLLVLLAPAPGLAIFPIAIQTVCDVDIQGCVGGVQGLHGARGVAVSPDDEHVYVVSSVDSGLAVFSRGADGRMAHVQTVLDGDPGIDGLGSASGVVVSPDGLHVYTAAAGDSAVAAWSRDPATGAVTPIEVELDDTSGVDGLGGAAGVAISPDGAHLYVAGGDDDAVAVFSRDAGDGTLTFLEAEIDGAGVTYGLDGAEALAVSPDGKHVYVASKADNAVVVFERASYPLAVDFGELTFVEAQVEGAGSNDGLQGAGAVALDSDGENVYVASERGKFDGIAGGDWVAVFSRSSPTGRLTFLESIAESDFVGFEGCTGVGNESSGVVVSPDDTMVLVTNPFFGGVAAFERRPADGGLRVLDSVCDRYGAGGLAGARAIAMSGDGLSVYAASPEYGTVTTLCTDGDDLDLTDTGVVSGDVTESACGTIIAGGAVGGYEIVAPADVSFLASKIRLDSGFSVGVDAVFGVPHWMGAAGDALAPELTIRYPSDGDGVLPGLAIAIGYRVEDDRLVDSYQLTAGGDVLLSATGVGLAMVEGEVLWTPPGTAQPGDSFLVEWRATDSDGKVGVRTITLEVPSGTLLTGDQELDSSRDGQSLVLDDGTFTVIEPIALASLQLLDGARVGGEAGEPLELTVAGRLRLDQGSEIDMTALGYPGGQSSSAARGGAPPGVLGAWKTHGGSHGGVGTYGEWDTGAPGEVFDSVYRPALGGGGAGHNWWACCKGTSGGGAVLLDVGTLVVNGEIRALGVDSNHSEAAAGAGGTVRVTAAAMTGAGTIDASGGGSTLCNSTDGVGGGGRVALHVDDLSGFDPLSGVQVWGGKNNCAITNHNYRAGAQGTLLVADAASTYGRLILDAGEFADGTDRPGLPTELPALGGDAVAAVEVSGADLWVTGPAAFLTRWVGAWMALTDAAGADLGTFQVAELDGAGRALLGGAGAVVGAAAYRGEYRFDRIDQRNGAGLASSDPLTATEVVISEGDSALPGRLTADEMTIASGAVARAGAEGIFEATVTGTMTIEPGGALDVTAQGYPGGQSPGQPGGAPPGIAPAQQTGGGSHGGVGTAGESGGPGEVYDSVYRPEFGGGGAGHNWWACCKGTSGGGVVLLDVGTLVLSGEIRAVGGESNHSEAAAGAGGTVRVTAAAMTGAGTIDASGGGSTLCNSTDGVGGGGRVALHVDDLSGFDAVSGVKVWGGENSCAVTNHNYRAGAQGTLLVADGASTYGRLIVDAGELADGTDRPSPPTELPELSSDAVAAVEVSGADLWVTGPAAFLTRWAGAWMALVDAAGADLGTFQVAELDGAGRARLTGAGAVAGAAAYRGEYRFDRIDQRNGAGLTIADPLTVTEVVISEGESLLPSRLAASELTIESGAVARAGTFEATVTGTMTIESGAALDLTGLGYPGGQSPGLPGGAPPGVAPAQQTGGGSHGGVGTAGESGGPGEVYDSVFWPALGGGGAGHNWWACCKGTGGGGAALLDVGTLVLDGEIRARSGDATNNNTASGAGGTVRVTAAAIVGAGTIDVSGGELSASCDPQNGVGGGGRVALHVDDLSGFDPAIRVTARGAVNNCTPAHSWFASAAPGTIYWLAAGGTAGELIVEHGYPTEPAPNTLLPAIGAGTIGEILPEAADPTAVWIAAEEIVPGEPVLFDLGVVGMWLRVNGSDYEVIDQSADRVRLLLADAAGAFSIGDPYQGVYKLDRLVVSGGATLEFRDLVEVPVVEVDEDSFLISPLADVQPPRVRILQPTDETSQREIYVTYEDPDVGSGQEGLVIATVAVEVDGASVLGSCVVTAAWTWCDLPLLTLGPHTVSVEIGDLEGNLGSATRAFTLVTPAEDEFHALADCAPRIGPRPLSVMLRSRGQSTGSAIERHRWDFEGDGVFDTDDETPVDYLHVFDTAGPRVPVLRVTNNLNQVATDRCLVAVHGNPPTAQASVSPSNGPAPLLVNLTCVGNDPDGPIALWEWDFDGDGFYEFSSDTSGDTTFTYTSEGEYVAVCRVTDGDGMVGLAPTAETRVSVTPAGAPTVEATADPASGLAPLLVTFSGSATDDGTIVLWEWDFDGDGSYTYSSGIGPDTTHTYTAAGVFGAALRVTDDQALSAVDTVAVTVEADATLSIPDDTFEPAAAETVTVDTSLTADAAVRILIKDRDGIVRRLLVDEFRLAGAYSDPWDGTDDLGVPLPHGPYYAILEYVVGSEVKMLDLTDSTGGTDYRISRPHVPPSFAPFDNDPLEIDFIISAANGASEVLAFIGLFNSGERFLTLVNREPFGVGTHRVIWDGTDADGNIAQPPPGDSFLVGFLGFTLPDNAIMLEAAPTISDVTVSPNVFDPGTPDYLAPGGPTAEITYSLDKTADVQLTVTNLDTGVVLRQIVEPLVAAGTGHVIGWDGRAADGRFVAPGDYRLTLRAVDSVGNTSLARLTLMRVFY